MILMYYITIHYIYIYIYIYICISKCSDMANDEHMVPDAFRSKKSSSASLVHEQQAPRK